MLHLLVTLVFLSISSIKQKGNVDYTERLSIIL